MFRLQLSPGASILDLFWPVPRYALEVGAGLLGAGAFAALGWILRRLRRQFNQRAPARAKTWPYVYGTIQYAQAATIGEGKNAYWIGELAYSYIVDGEYYSGFCQLPASNEDEAWNAVRGWKDRKVIVHYRPQYPSTSVLVVEEQDQPPGTDSSPR
jgi:hypothetical protein